MKKNYLSNPSYNYDQVNRASLACGPMVKWAIAQVRKPKQIRVKMILNDDPKHTHRFYFSLSLIMLTC